MLGHGHVGGLRQSAGAMTDQSRPRVFESCQARRPFIGHEVSAAVALAVLLVSLKRWFPVRFDPEEPRAFVDGFGALAPVVLVVLGLLAAGTLVTLWALVGFRTYFGAVETVQKRRIEGRRYLAVLLASLVIVPLILAVLPFRLRGQPSRPGRADPDDCRLLRPSHPGHIRTDGSNGGRGKNRTGHRGVRRDAAVEAGPRTRTRYLPRRGDNRPPRDRLRRGELRRGGAGRLRRAPGAGPQQVCRAALRSEGRSRRAGIEGFRRRPGSERPTARSSSTPRGMTSIRSWSAVTGDRSSPGCSSGQSPKPCYDGRRRPCWWSGDVAGFGRRWRATPLITH